MSKGYALKVLDNSKWNYFEKIFAISLNKQFIQYTNEH